MIHNYKDVLINVQMGSMDQEIFAKHVIYHAIVVQVVPVIIAKVVAAQDI